MLESAKLKGIGKPMFLRDRKKTLEQKLTANLEELAKNPNAEILPITAGLAASQDSERELDQFLKKAI